MILARKGIPGPELRETPARQARKGILAHKATQVQPARRVTQERLVARAIPV